METTIQTDNLQNAEPKKTNFNTKMAAAAVVGAALGVGTTQAVASNRHHEEAEIPEDVIAEQPTETQPEEPKVVEHHHTETVYVHQPEVIVVPVAKPAPTTQGGGEPDIVYTGYGTVTLESGAEVDVIRFEANGRPGLIIDVDRNGTADAIMFDRNGNGNIDESEFVMIEPQNQFSMGELRAEIDGKGNDDLPDYTKDADGADILAEEDVDVEEDTTDDDIAVVDDNNVEEEVTVTEENYAAEEPAETVDNFTTDDIAEAPDYSVESMPSDDFASNDFSAGGDVADTDML